MVGSPALLLKQNVFFRMSPIGSVLFFSRKGLVLCWSLRMPTGSPTQDLYIFAQGPWQWAARFLKVGTWRMGSQLDPVVRIPPPFISQNKAIWRKGITTGIGDLRSPWLLTTYESWDDPPSRSGYYHHVPYHSIFSAFVCFQVCIHWVSKQQNERKTNTSKVGAQNVIKAEFWIDICSRQVFMGTPFLNVCLLPSIDCLMFFLTGFLQNCHGQQKVFRIASSFHKKYPLVMVAQL